MVEETLPWTTMFLYKILHYTVTYFARAQHYNTAFDTLTTANNILFNNIFPWNRPNWQKPLILFYQICIHFLNNFKKNWNKFYKIIFIILFFCKLFYCKVLVSISNAAIISSIYKRNLIHVNRSIF